MSSGSPVGSFASVGLTRVSGAALYDVASAGSDARRASWKQMMIGSIADLEEEILSEHSRRQAERIARWAGKDRRRFGLLMRAFLRGEYRVTQRAAWAVGICAERNPALIRPYLGKMISRMLEPGVHPAVQRNVVRLLQDVEIPGPLLGKVASSCFDLLFSADAPVAVKVFSMSVLARIALKRPDLCRELQLAINQQIPFATAGFRSRARRVLRSLGIPEHTIGPGPGQTEVDFPELY